MILNKYYTLEADVSANVGEVDERLFSMHSGMQADIFGCIRDLNGTKWDQAVSFRGTDPRLITVFRGNHLLTLDDKGRLSVKKYHLALEEEYGPKPRMAITIDPYEDCLVVYPFTEWKQVEEKLIQLPGLGVEAEEGERVKAAWTHRLIIGNVEYCNLDSHGRLLVSSDLRERVGISLDKDRKEERQVRMVGRMKTFELWSEPEWKRRVSEQRERNRRTVDRLMRVPAEPEPEPAAA